MVGVPGQPVPLQHLGDPLGALGRRHALVLQAVGDVLRHGGVHDLRVGVLEDEAHAAAHLAHVRAGVEAVDAARCPVVGTTRPLSRRAKVLLPEPLAPTMPIRRSVSRRSRSASTTRSP